ncbi:hypothetical protein JQK87_06735, partial [Streptomyces sp. G44]|uniref:hypothetical protein n=1 Tax=Streptomyces sp. G44 TaxID=2807632 RepID=UPI0019609CE2
MGDVSVVVRWEAEPWLTLRERRGGRVGASGGWGAAAWLAEPSLTERVRRAGRSPAAARPA